MYSGTLVLRGQAARQGTSRRKRFLIARRLAAAGDDGKLQRVGRRRIADAQRVDGRLVRRRSQPGDVLRQGLLAAARAKECVEHGGDDAHAVLRLELAHRLAEAVLRSADGHEEPFARADLLADAQPRSPMSAIR